MAKKVRGTTRTALRHPTHGGMVVVFGNEFAAADKLVKAFPWAFVPVESVESATAAPGEKRTTRKPKKTAAKS